MRGVRLSPHPHATTVLSQVGDVPPPPEGAGVLKVSGLTIVSYVALRLAPNTLDSAVARGRLAVEDHLESYATKLERDSPIRCGALRVLPQGLWTPPLPATRPGSPRFQLVWTGPEYAVAAVPVAFALDEELIPGAMLVDAPLSVVDVLSLIRDLTSSKVSKRIEDGVADAVADGLRAGVRRSWTIQNMIGIQIWCVDGTPERPTRPYHGVDESRKYSWELSALMSYSADHVLMDDLWKKREPRQVFEELQVGFSFFGDHMAFVNETACLEVANVTADPRPRVRYRLQSYRYDSSALYVWWLAALRRAVLGDLARRYDDLRVDLAERRTIGFGELTSLITQHVGHEALLDELDDLRESLVEPRNRALLKRVESQQATARALGRARRVAAQAVSLATELSRARAEKARERTNFFLAALGVVVTVFEAPSMVGEVSRWIDAGAWSQLAVTVVLLLGVVTIVATLWWRSRRS